MTAKPALTARVVLVDTPAPPGRGVAPGSAPELSVTAMMDASARPSDAVMPQTGYLETPVQPLDPADSFTGLRYGIEPGRSR
jgi:hypothetical protein